MTMAYFLHDSSTKSSIWPGCLVGGYHFQGWSADSLFLGGPDCVAPAAIHHQLLAFRWSWSFRHRGTPSHHLNFNGMFPHKPSSELGVSPWGKPPYDWFNKLDILTAVEVTWGPTTVEIPSISTGSIGRMNLVWVGSSCFERWDDEDFIYFMVKFIVYSGNCQAKSRRTQHGFWRGSWYYGKGISSDIWYLVTRSFWPGVFTRTYQESLRFSKLIRVHISLHTIASQRFPMDNSVWLKNVDIKKKYEEKLQYGS